jgi:hypothetical protein
VLDAEQLSIELRPAPDGCRRSPAPARPSRGSAGHVAGRSA